MRADRLIAILLLLQANHHMTTRDLAHRLEVSARTIHRDMQALSTSGIPIYAERGYGGGWRLQENYNTVLTSLNTAEIWTLFLSTPSHLLHDLGLQQASEAALRKLLASLPTLSQRDAAFARQRLHIDGAGWFPARKDDVSCLPLLQEALWQERKIQFRYQRGQDIVERLADPLGLVAKGHTWYLVASVDNDIRSYRVSRIRTVTLLHEQCVRPTDFHLPHYWEQSTATFTAHLPRFSATLRVSPCIIERVREHRRIEMEYPPDPDGWIRLRFTFDVIEEACRYALSFGSHLRVEAPQELQTMVITHIHAMYTLYHT